MDVFLSKCINFLHTKPMIQEILHDKVCISARYSSVKISRNVTTIMDSGAFQDRSKHTRVSFEDAYNRQIKFETKLGFESTFLVPYDNIDDTNTTINALDYMIEHTNNRCILPVVQGETLEEKVYCYNYIRDLGFDYIGFGGIAKIAVNKAKRQLFINTLNHINDKYDLEKIHLFGVGNLSILQEIRDIVGKDVYMSSDTSVIEVGSVMGRVFSNGVWKKIYNKTDEKLGLYHAKDLYDQNVINILPYYEAI